MRVEKSASEQGVAQGREQGIILPEQGIFLPEQGIFLALKDDWILAAVD
jgi:hypothetical protein